MLQCTSVGYFASGRHTRSALAALRQKCFNIICDFDGLDGRALGTCRSFAERYWTKTVIVSSTAWEAKVVKECQQTGQPILSVLTFVSPSLLFKAVVYLAQVFVGSHDKGTYPGVAPKTNPEIAMSKKRDKCKFTYAFRRPCGCSADTFRMLSRKKMRPCGCSAEAVRMLCGCSADAFRNGLWPCGCLGDALRMLRGCISETMFLPLRGRIR